MAGEKRNRGGRRLLPRPSLLALAGLGALTLLVATPSHVAAQESCQAEFQELVNARVAILRRIQGFQQRRPTAQQACATFRSLRAADQRLATWMGTNKDWCRIPDEIDEQLKVAFRQAANAQTQACRAAAQQASEAARIRREGQAGGAPIPPGGGVRLPQGAL